MIFLGGISLRTSSFVNPLVRRTSRFFDEIRALDHNKIVQFVFRFFQKTNLHVGFYHVFIKTILTTFNPIPQYDFGTCLINQICLEYMVNSYDTKHKLQLSDTLYIEYDYNVQVRMSMFSA